MVAVAGCPGGRVSSPAEVPVGVFWLGIHLLGWWNPFMRAVRVSDRDGVHPRRP